MKRFFDLIFSFLGLIILSPVIIFACFGIYLQDKHSPFYIAKRTGKNNKNFNMIKLRSMIVNAEKTRVDSTSSNDLRITKIGKFIRNGNYHCGIDAGFPPFRFSQSVGWHDRRDVARR